MILKIITPENVILEQDVKGVFVKAIDGELGILQGHTPLLTALDIGVAHYTNPDDSTDYMSIIGGTLKVENDEVLVLTENAESGDEIDIARAELAADRARAKIQGFIDQSVDKSDPSYEKARLALLRALARIKASSSISKN